MMAVHLSAPGYVLGEIEQEHHEIPDFAARAHGYGMQPYPRLWGWGRVRRTERPLTDLVVDCGRAVTGSTEVDLLLLCSTRFPGDARTHGRFLQTIMTGLGLDCAFLGLTLNRCTNLLTALGVAEAFVAAGRYRSILVITADRCADESARMENFALFSDGAAGCLVTAAPGDYELLGAASAEDVKALDWGSEISADLSRRVNDALLTPHGLVPGDLAGLMHSNLFVPIVVMKELQAGFTPRQLDTGNTARIGHCFAADPLIALADRGAEPGAHYLLAASVPGSRAAVLLRSTAVRSEALDPEESDVAVHPA